MKLIAFNSFDCLDNDVHVIVLFRFLGSFFSGNTGWGMEVKDVLQQ